MATTDPRTATEGQWADLVSKVKAKQDQLTAGTGININNNVISATGGSIFNINVTYDHDTDLYEGGLDGVWTGTTFAQIQAAVANNPKNITISLVDTNADPLPTRVFDVIVNEEDTQVSGGIAFSYYDYRAGFCHPWLFMLYETDNYTEVMFESFSAYNIEQSLSHKAAITLTTTDPGEGAALTANNFVGVYGGDPIIMDYSTSEVNTGAKWINGSAIYKKTVNFGALPNNANKDVAHGISNLSYVIDITGTVTTTDGYFLPINMPMTTSLDAQIRCVVDSANIRITTGSDRSTNTAYVTLYYTKSS